VGLLHLELSSLVTALDHAADDRIRPRRRRAERHWIAAAAELAAARVPLAEHTRPAID